jgi:hypothetical protein
MLKIKTILCNIKIQSMIKIGRVTVYKKNLKFYL